MRQGGEQEVGSGISSSSSTASTAAVMTAAGASTCKAPAPPPGHWRCSCIGVCGGGWGGVGGVANGQCAFAASSPHCLCVCVPAVAAVPAASERASTC
jgi:hypothetical protein